MRTAVGALRSGLKAWRPDPHWPSVRGRARADAGPLSLVACVIAVVALFAGATPPLLRLAADEAAREAVRRSADEAAIRVDADWRSTTTEVGAYNLRDPAAGAFVAALAPAAKLELDPGLQAVLRPPVTTVSSISLAVGDGSVQRRLQLNYLRSDSGEPAVTWVAGRAPAASSTDLTIRVPQTRPPWPVQIGVSEAEAVALNVSPGDRIPVKDDSYKVYDVRVSGIFRPVDPDDRAWSHAPWLLQPTTGQDGRGTTRFGGLLSADSLPDARLAFLDDQLRRSVRLDVEPEAFTWKSAQALATTVAALKGTSGASAERDETLKWSTQLDSLLRDVDGQVAAATAQATVLLIAVLAGALLVIGLAVELLTRRRAVALATVRGRGVALPSVTAELAVESVAVAVPAALMGIAVAVAVAGSASLGGILPFLLLAVAASPVAGTLAAARATRDKRVPANRSARRWAGRTVLLRRIAVDVAVVLLAVGALVALLQRGIGSSADGDAALPAAAPTLCALAVSLLLVRLMPRITGLRLRLALRSRRPLALFGPARAAATSGRVLPALTLIATIALASFAVTLYATTERGLSVGAWQSTGADARLDLSYDSTVSATAIADRLATYPGVRQAVAGEVISAATFVAEGDGAPSRLIVVDTAAFRELAAGNPLPGLQATPALTTLVDGAIPALVRSRADVLRPGLRFTLPRRDADEIDLVAVGSIPAMGLGDDVVVVDSAAARTAGLEFTPNTVWASGPGAAQAVRAQGAEGSVTTQADVLTANRTAPPTAGLLRLDLVSAAALLALGLLGFAVAAATSAPERGQTLARLRTLGLRPRDTRRVAAAELSPPLVAAAICAPVVGVLLAWVSLDSLALRRVTGQTATPELVIPWWTIGVTTVVALAAVLIAVVAAESSARRRRGLGDVLRVGES
ncbi:FtsX-like permease family protein [Actinoplanes sp. NPDC048988]|uniref:FtsX-like permease family protein n=1 Tax=Actinoplanes sp. NPDC048988 TaxID=3363901 RepID=UPI003714A0EB